MNPRIMRCSMGFVEAYLSYVLPVGTDAAALTPAGTCVDGLVARTTRSASRPTVIACSDAMRISSVLAASRKSLSIQSKTSLASPTASSVRPTGRNTFSGLYDSVIRTTCSR